MVLFGVLLKFRVFNVAVVGDIEKAFLQISLSCEYVHFLWFSDVHKNNFSNSESNKFVEYRFCRVLLEVASPPFYQFYHLDPNFFVSMLNLLHIEFRGSYHGEALEFFMTCKEGLALGGFNLCKFRSNSKKSENLVVEKFHEEISNENTILGLQWEKNSDKIIYDITKICKKYSNSYYKTHNYSIFSKYI